MMHIVIQSCAKNLLVMAFLMLAIVFFKVNILLYYEVHI